ncbi:hypothetical protein [Fibrella aquatilis]|uniref:Uncharacterized protein n=1 Tax=Fibrella aquatilis TaxID=2817059 RepID=A0A939G4C0_9BACT|nr:hypothetical protein [Fibrella aquatilis]MBO0930002.1 hypothetical protein [Fibrella aquatilis]
MSTAQILFEQYKVRPPRIRRELKTLIDQEAADEKVPLREQIRQGMREVRLVKEGKLKAQSLGEFLADLSKEIADEA